VEPDAGLACRGAELGHLPGGLLPLFLPTERGQIEVVVRSAGLFNAACHRRVRVEDGVTLAKERADRAAREHEISIAMLVVLETLSPAERAVFVLREVFGMPHDEVAATLGRTPASVRQLAHRAREHVDDRRPRFDADASKQRQATEQFLQACVTGDMSTLLELLAPDVSLVSDGGGQAKAARRPVLGADKVARLMIGISQDGPASNVEYARINGAIGVVGYDGDSAIFVGLLDLIDEGIASIYIMVNPDKLQHLHR
jgi:hypothetical protein